MVIIKESIEINCSPGVLWNFLIHLDHEQAFQKWHPKDHIRLLQLNGNMEEPGTVVYFEEYLGKSRMRLVCKVVKVRKHEYIEFKPLFPISLLQFGKGQFLIETRGAGCLFTIAVEYGYKIDLVGPLSKWLIESYVVKERDIRQHTKEELIILKDFLERRPFSKPQGSMTEQAEKLRRLTASTKLKNGLRRVVHRALS